MKHAADALREARPYVYLLLLGLALPEVRADRGANLRLQLLLHSQHHEISGVVVAIRRAVDRLAISHSDLLLLQLSIVLNSQLVFKHAQVGFLEHLSFLDLLFSPHGRDNLLVLTLLPRITAALTRATLRAHV